jgi:acetylornithine deacetylase/succinyl-diaminopimelate desuccinylase-like protein
VVELIRKHLAANGYDDIEVRVLEGYPPCKTSVNTPLIQTTLAVYKKWGIEPAVWPRIAGSAPFYVFTDWLNQSFSYMGIGHGGRHHVPDEYLVVEGNGIVADLMDAEKAWVDTLFALGEG